MTTPTFPFAFEGMPLLFTRIACAGTTVCKVTFKPCVRRRWLKRADTYKVAGVHSLDRDVLTQRDLEFVANKVEHEARKGAPFLKRRQAANAHPACFVESLANNDCVSLGSFTNPLLYCFLLLRARKKPRRRNKKERRKERSKTAKRKPSSDKERGKERLLGWLAERDTWHFSTC